jgi:hypothetical protein
LRFRSAASAYLNRTPASAGNRKTWTWSGWVKRGALGGTQALMGARLDDSNRDYFYFNSDNALAMFDRQGGTNIVSVVTPAVFRDPSAWYHVVWAIDTTQATSTNRIKVYVNGVQQTLTFNTTPSQNADLYINTAQPHRIGDLDGSVYFDGYMTEVNFIDGQALTPSSFGGTNAVTGVWEPRQYTGTYGTNGFYLNFKDNTSTTTLGYDYSGNSNNWTTNNISLTAGSTYDSMLDVPTQWIGYGNAYETTRGNYATLNPLNSPSGVTLSSGNLNYTSGGSSNNTIAYSTISVSSGKWYAEYTHTTGTQLVGIAASTASATLSYPGQDATSYGYASNNGEKYNNGASAYGATWTANDVIGIALDLDAGTLTFYKNGTSQGTAFTGITGTYKFGIGNNSGSTVTGVMNFGQRPFAYTPPTGFKSLCTTNLPSPTILQGDDYFNAVLWTGNGSSQTISSYDFQPDFAWIKSRSTSDNHNLMDAVRGATKRICSNLSSAESTETQMLTAFTSNGFSLGTDAGVNGSGATYVGLAWKANGAGSSNTAGSITSTVSASPTAGFSVVTYTGTGANATVGHGLGVAPTMFIVKRRDTIDDWFVYNQNIGNTNYLRLNSVSASATFNFWQNTNPTSSVFSISSDVSVNGSGSTYVAYCFAPVAGYSAFGSYAGNGSADGAFVYTGFRPKFVMIRSTSNLREWFMVDTARSTYNVVNLYLRANTSSAQGTDTIMDIVSNGFKMRNSDTAFNGSGETYIYMAFAENPFKNALAR